MIKNQFPFSTTCGIKCFNLNLNGDYYIDLYSDISHSFRLHMSVLMHQAFRTPLYTLRSRGDCSIYAGQVLMGSNYRLYNIQISIYIYILKNRSTCVNREAYRFIWFIRWGNDWMIPKPCKTAAIRTLRQYFPTPSKADRFQQLLQMANVKEFDFVSAKVSEETVWCDEKKTHAEVKKVRM